LSGHYHQSKEKVEKIKVEGKGKHKIYVYILRRNKIMCKNCKCLVKIEEKGNTKGIGHLRVP
jgi:hypothetical protein